MRRLAEMSWREAERVAKEVGSVLLPIGSLEQHGPHLPLSTDSLIAEKVSELISSRTGIPVAPTLNYGISFEHEGFAGTVTLSPRTFIELICEVAESLKTKGFERVFVINGHAGNRGALDAAARELKSKGVNIYVFDVQSMVIEAATERGVKVAWREHAGAIETSLVLALARELVKGLPKGKVDGPKHYEHVSYGWSASEHSSDGFIGEPASASEELGKELIKAVFERICEVIGEVSCSRG